MQERLRIPTKIAAGLLFAWFISFPVTVNALGFGNINMKSALNEPLVAEIELLSATKDDVKALEVKLASSEAFLRAGVDRSVILTRIKFDIVKRGGKYFINLRTPESVREPFLNFLLEMNWKNGRMLREYTVLLDPPERRQQQRIAQAPETTPAETFVEPAPAPMAEPEPMPAPEPIAAAPEPMPAPESPFLEAPAPEPSPQTDEPLFPQVALDSEPQVPSEGSGAAAMAEPEPVPAPMPEPMPVPEPISGPELVSAPEPAPAPEPVALPEDGVVSVPEAAFQEEEDGLFPQVPMRAYNEAALAAAEMPEPADSELGVVATPDEVYEPVGELDYGITRKGDSAWKIAEKLKPSEQVSVYQVMMALQQGNPGAFADGNIHRLKQGQVLRIDDASLLTAMSKAQAAEQYQLQTTAWEEYLTSVGADVPRQAIVAGEETGGTEAAGEPGGELTLATPSGDDLSAGTGGGAAGASSEDTALLREQVRQAMSEASTERNKNANLVAKLEQLEQELKRLENVVTVKDSDLAALQARLNELNQQPAAEPAPTSAVQPEPTPEPASEFVPEPVPEAAPAEPAPADIAATEPEPEPIAPIEPDPLTPLDEAVEPSPLDPVEVPAEPGMPAEEPQASSGGIMATIMGIVGGLGSVFSGGMMPIIIGAVVAVVLILLIVIIIRRRKGVHFQESILDGKEPDSVAMDATPSQDSSLMGGESSFLSDFAISGVSAIQAEDSEVDPLTEADVFMAYGRYEAAEERLQEAITNDAGRGELRVKLLELFNTTKNKQGFETAAEDFYATLGEGAAADPLWQKVVAMGSEIAPGNPLFSGEGMPTMNTDALSTPEPMNLGNDEVMDIGLDTGVFSNSELTGADSDVGSTEAAAEAYTGGDADLDLGLGAGTDTAGSADAGLDFSLDSDESSAEIAVPAGGDLDFSLGSDGESTQTAMPAEGALDFSLDADSPTTGDLGGGDDLDFNLDLGGGDEDPTATDIKLDMADDSSASSGLDFDLNTEDDSSGDTEPGMDMNLDAGDALDLEMTAGGDEVGTKLDLARAYIDMGDPDGARSILDEVIDEGDEGQKQEAQQLMTQIG